jgi:hypothetical protein
MEVVNGEPRNVGERRFIHFVRASASSPPALG